MILMINYYKDENPARQAEIDECLRKNIEHPLIDHILIFKEENVAVHKNKKIIPVNWKGRPTYSDYFRIGSKYNDIKILANSDIYFDSSLMYSKKIRFNQVYALCRWTEVNGTLKFYNHKDSQDVWIWLGKINVNCEFSLGVPGCDNAIAYLLASSGYRVLSPSKSVKAIHLHNSGVRNYIKNKDRVQGPYLYLKYY